MTTTTLDSNTIADADLQADVEEELDWDPAVPSQSIGVSVTDHAVTLAGTVHALAHRLAAVKAARRVKGVHAIVDEIVVLPIGAHGSSDENIGLSVQGILESNATLPAGIRATVRNGVVTLTGTVDYQFQKINALRVIREVKGVARVQNDIEVKAKASEKVVRGRIVAAMHRNADLDARDIHVTTEGREVWLSGHVHSLAAKSQAEHAAWAAPGVQVVHNNIHVDWE
jgi:osmotically-inducible protein OsmY